ncbi:hypothetical protein LINPERHAP2_LOCUS9634 [Linum perenne]
MNELPGPRRHYRSQAPLSDHQPPSFRCCTTFWARWDVSPDRHVIHDIHDIIKAYEESQLASSMTNTCQKRNKKRSSRRKEYGGELVAGWEGEVSSNNASFKDGKGGDVEKSTVRKRVSMG